MEAILGILVVVLVAYMLTTELRKNAGAFKDIKINGFKGIKIGDGSEKIFQFLLDNGMSLDELKSQARLLDKDLPAIFTLKMNPIKNGGIEEISLRASNETKTLTSIIIHMHKGVSVDDVETGIQTQLGVPKLRFNGIIGWIKGKHMVNIITDPGNQVMVTIYDDIK